MSAFDRLIEQIDAFIRKYYKNEMLKGVLVFTGFLLASWLLVSGLEYFGRFSSTVRLVLLIVFILGNGFILGRYFIKPLLNLYAFGKRIDRKQAASIIGSFFPNVSDRLLNTLQLNEVNNPDDRSYELLRASVAQRSNELSAVAFVDAVRYQESKRYLKYVIPVALAFLAVGVFVPSWLVDGSSSVMNYELAQPAPFSFRVVSNTGAIDEGESVTIEAEITGKYIPENTYIVSDRGRFLMKKTRKNRVAFTFENMKASTDFHFEAEDIRSDNFHINVIGKSSLGKLVAELHYPKYLGKKDEIVSNIADLDLPEGTQVNWTLAARNVKSIAVLWNDSTRFFPSDQAEFSAKYRSSGQLRFVMKNAVTSKADTASVQLKIIKDAFPTIFVNEAVDSLRASVRSFEGMVSDDYGLTSLKFHYVIKSKEGKERRQSLSVQSVSGTSDKFVFTVDFSREQLDVEDKISYYFTVSDNDGVNGSKVTRSQAFVYELPTLQDLNEKRDEVQKDVQNALQDMLRKAEKFQRDVDRLQKSMNSQSKADFKTLEQIQQLQQEQLQLQQEMEAIQEKLQESTEEKNQLSEMDEELLKQQELIEELMKEVMDDELKKLLEDLEELLRKNEQNQLKEESEKLDQSTEEMKQQLDRTLESLKRLQVNEKIDDIEKELQELAKEQEELKKDIEKNQVSEEKAKEQQKEIDKKFDEIKEDLNELKKLNEELERPMELDDFKEQQESIDQKLGESSEQLEKGKKSKAGEKQQQAADEMKQLSEQLNSQQQESNQKQNAEDMGLLRLLLENLMSLSFSQEENLQSFVKVKDTDPAYRRLGRKQRGIIDDTKVVEDSLLALAKRQPKIATFIDKELKEINANFGMIVDEIDEHERRQLGQHQQLVMTSYNNLALLLNESLQSMQQQAQAQQPGNGSCNNPGGSGQGQPKPGGEMSPQDMKEMLKQQLEQMKKGPNPGGKQPGDKPGQGQGGQGMQGLGNKEIAKMAAQQTAIRQRLEQLRNEMNKEGQGKGNALNPLIKELEQQEKDLINKNFSPEMLRRQQDILTRLLESEKALRERGFEEKRESESGKDKNYGNLIRFDEYNRQKLGQVEILRAVDPMLSKYYKDKAGEYFNRTQ